MLWWVELKERNMKTGCCWLVSKVLLHCSAAPTRILPCIFFFFLIFLAFNVLSIFIYSTIQAYKFCYKTLVKKEFVVGVKFYEAKVFPCTYFGNGLSTRVGLWIWKKCFFFSLFVCVFAQHSLKWMLKAMSEKQNR